MKFSMTIGTHDVALTNLLQYTLPRVPLADHLSDGEVFVLRVPVMVIKTRWIGFVTDCAARGFPQLPDPIEGSAAAILSGADPSFLVSTIVRN